MAWWMPHNFARKKDFVIMRMNILRQVRNFFDKQEFMSVETPALQVMPTADTHIHGFQTNYFGPDLKPQRDLYLHTSPELAMKKLLVAGCENIYQICPVYRNGEDTRLHSPEFTMLEWYRAGADYTAMMNDCEAMVRHIASQCGIHTLRHGGHEADPLPDFERLSVRDAFMRYADMDLERVLEDKDGFSNCARQAGIRVTGTDEWDDIFFAVMAEKIEPYLGMQTCTILYDYPKCMAALSRLKPRDPRYAERFEIYICGVETANAFTELTDAVQQRYRFEQDLKAKQEIYGYSYPQDEDFLKALEFGMPESAGCALGLDRLIMLCAGADNIEDIMWTEKP